MIYYIPRIGFSGWSLFRLLNLVINLGVTEEFVLEGFMLVSHKYISKWVLQNIDKQQLT